MRYMRVRDRFEILEKLGKGAMSVVFAARDRDRQLDLALKFLQDLGARTQSLFQEEVRLLSRLSHPYLVKIFDYFPPNSGETDPFAAAFFSMEKLSGLPFPGSPSLGTQRAIDLLGKLCQAFHYLHGREILHRDLKPANVLVLPNGDPKLLDFGLSIERAQSTPASGPVGTLAYLPPEAYAGDYEFRSDLFGLGVLFYEALSGKKPFSRPLTAGGLRQISPPVSLKEIRKDLPDFLCNLVHRLLALSPSDRPSSALQALAYLNEHVDPPFRVEETFGTGGPLDRPPLVGRSDTLKHFLADWEKRDRTRPLRAEIRGPVGVGRSRFLEEIKWPLQLKGIPFYSFGPAAPGNWLRDLERRLSCGTPASSGIVVRVQAILRALQNREVCLALTDLHLCSEADAEALGLFLQAANNFPGPWTLLLEYADETPFPLQAALRHSEASWDQSLVISLSDLSDSEARDLVQACLPPKLLEKHDGERLVSEAGGRPLLLLESLRHLLGLREKEVPSSLEESTRKKLRQLSALALRILARVAVHPSGLALQELEVWENEGLEGIWELDRWGLLKREDRTRNRWTLAHASLRSLLEQALPAPLLQAAHRERLDLFLQKAPDPPRACAEAAAIAKHALALREGPLLRRWGTWGAQYLESRGESQKALALYRSLLDFAEDAADQAWIHAHLAPLHYRLGRYAEAVEAYDAWFRHREDDESRLQKVKYLFYLGLCHKAWGKPESAEEYLAACLETGDDARHPPHRPYHARALLLRGALAQEKTELDAALSYFQQALPLAEGQALLLGEVEQNLGQVQRARLDFSAALKHFQNSLAQYRLSQNPQATALAEMNLSLIHRDRGEAELAERHAGEALRMAEAGGEVLQVARYRENAALLAMERGRYETARRLLEEARPLLEAFGKDTDRRILEIHWASFYFQVGNFHRGREMLARLTRHAEEIQALGLETALGFLTGEAALREGDERRALDRFQDIVRKSAGPAGKSPTELDRLRARWETFTALAWNGSWNKAEDTWREWREKVAELAGPRFVTWRKFLDFFLQDPKEWKERGLEELWEDLQKVPWPEWRESLCRILAKRLARHGMKNPARRIAAAAAAQRLKIFQALPEELKMDFEKNRPLFSLDENPEEKNSFSPARNNAAETLAEDHRFHRFSEITRQINKKKSLAEILDRVMDVAIELTGAERGFLLLQSSKAGGGPLKGFEVRSARNLNQASLHHREFQFSLSAVEEAMKLGTFVLSDNAQTDERFQSQESVMQFQLKSILTVPLEIDGQVLGALYLDHRYQPNRFTEEKATLLSAFAAQAALAIEKSRMLAELEAANKKLAERVAEQESRIEVLNGELTQAREELKYEYREIIGASPAMMRVFQLLDHVSETAIPVWIFGESGTGKELVARSLHYNSPRKEGPFVSENCSAIPETLLESELFGHVKGAFTHADRDRKGLFEQAHGGTLFLDEIGDMPSAMQTKLLRVLQEGEVRPVGSNKRIKVNIRLVTATHRDLRQEVQRKKFRQDLFFRINGLTIELPPLRERKEDIPLLVNALIPKMAKNFGLPASELTDDAFQALYRHAWPGNVRELEGILRNALLFAKGRPIGPEYLHLAESAVPLETSPATVPKHEDGEERRLILQALSKHRLNKEKAARELEISLRTLYSRMELYKIPKKKPVLAKFLLQAGLY